MMSEDLPDPDNPVTTMSLFFGILSSTFFKLLDLAPLMWIVFNRFLLFIDIF